MAYTTIKKPSDYFNTKLYTGNGSTQSITGVGFQPDWTWIKSRGDTSNHRIYDGVRGATKVIYSNLTNAEGTDANGLTSFDSDGFSLGTEGQSNGNGVNFASWNWLGANGTSANTDGSISSTVSASATSGFSIVTVSKPNTNVATIGHGLGVVPAMIIGKNLASGFRWIVYQKTIGNTKAQYLNENFTNTTSTTFWNDTSPTSSVFTIGSDNSWNGTSVFYCFAEKKGYSKFGSYTGNGNADGTFVYTGFKPSLIIIKDTVNAGENWFIFDNKRPGYNFNANLLNPNSATTETTSGANGIDIISNGFKARSTNNGTNRSGANFIYMAFAENPLVGTNNIPATAR